MDFSHIGVFIVLCGPPIVLGYLLGSVPFGLVITKLAGLGDIRTIGSGNIGATNVLRTGRKDLALATLLLDAGKAGLAYFLCIWGMKLAYDDSMTPGYFHSFGLIAGAAAFVGHCYPVWLGFNGGKGVATYVGLLFAAAWPAGLIFGGVWLATAFIFRMSSFAALLATLVVPVFSWYMNPNGDDWIVFGVLAVLIYWRHRANIQRLLSGTEPKIGSKKKAAAEANAPPGPPA